VKRDKRVPLSQDANIRY